MAKRAKHSQLEELDAALGEGRTEDARRVLLDLSEDERAVLQEYLGKEELLELYKAATRRRRGPSLGRVVVLPGLMGTNLDSVDASGDADRVWMNIVRVFGGRVSDLRLGEDGQPLPSPPSVRTAGIHSGTYLKLLFELQAYWDAIAFAYDWRADLRQSAAALAERIREWAKGEPVHLVAHSMGGILARTFIRQFPDAWAGMQDRTGKGRGGRLVMLGTPNRGAFAIVLALSGEEKLVKMLAKLDRKHDLTQLLQILNTFPGSYQLLPSPRADLGDDHRRLFDAAAWGSLPVRQGLLRQGEQFQEWLHPVIDPDRMVFVAGYGQPTPVRVRIEGPGRFTYDVTDEGDGRVPHSLGLLEDVRTYWVKEKHGDLAKNKSVLQAMHVLLQTGETLLLESARPRVRAAAAPAYRKADTFETVPPEMEAVLTQVRGRRDLRIGDREAARIQAHLLADYLGSPEPSAGAKAPTARRRAGAGRKPSLEIEVVWSDIREAGANVYVAGAYWRVPPAGPLRALDEALSEGLPKRVIEEQINRGLVTARFGDVDFFPWDRGRVVAVAGMGYAGSFREGDLRRLTRSIVWAVNGLPRARSLATVLIGSGDGNLGVPAAVRAMLQGLADAVVQGGAFSRVSKVVLVEFWLDRALEIQAALKQQLERPETSPILDLVDVRLAPQVGKGANGAVGYAQNAGLLLASARSAAAAPGSPEDRALDVLLRRASKLGDQPTLLRQSFRKAALVEALERSPLAKLRFGSVIAPLPAPTRVSFFAVGDQIRSTVITDTSTVTERVLRLDPQLVRETVERMTEPEADSTKDLGKLLRGLLLHEDFSDKVSSTGGSPLVFEVDRMMAPVHWEMMADEDGEALSLHVAVARQLRTTFSPGPMMALPPGQLRALVIGDPGDPAAGQSLPGARREASVVAALLRRKGLEVVELIGAPGPDGRGPVPNISPATRLDVLAELLKGGFDLLHYSGHGDFDPRQPDRVGWVFKGGLLTPGELERVARAPRLIVANACLSALTSFTTVSGVPLEGRYEAALAPSLADEFFRRGVQDYIGTAWPIDDTGAVLFATTFYEELLADADQPATIGDALLRARSVLADPSRLLTFGSLWAAYQHYGDPRRRFRVRAGGVAASPQKPAARGASARPGAKEAGIRKKRRRRA